LLAPSRGLPERERHRLGRFLTGIRVTTNNPKAPSSRANPRVIKRLSTQGANTLRFNLKDGTTQTVAVSFLSLIFLLLDLFLTTYNSRHISNRNMADLCASPTCSVSRFVFPHLQFYMI
jgi:transposase InsO family protein